MTHISDDLMDALREIINIGVGKAAGTLNELLTCHITLEVPQIAIIHPDDLDSHISNKSENNVSLVSLQFSGKFSGLSTLVLTQDSASKLVDLLIGEDVSSDEMDAIKAGTLTEIGNILLNAVMGSIGNILDSRLSYAIPTYQEGSLRSLLLPAMRQESAALEVTTRFTVQSNQITGEFLLLFEVGSFDSFVVTLEMAINK